MQYPESDINSMFDSGFIPVEHLMEFSIEGCVKTSAPGCAHSAGVGWRAVDPIPKYLTPHEIDLIFVRAKNEEWRG